MQWMENQRIVFLPLNFFFNLSIWLIAPSRLAHLQHRHHIIWTINTIQWTSQFDSERQCSWIWLLWAQKKKNNKIKKKKNRSVTTEISSMCNDKMVLCYNIFRFVCRILFRKPGVVSHNLFIFLGLYFKWKENIYVWPDCEPNGYIIYVHMCVLCLCAIFIMAIINGYKIAIMENNVLFGILKNVEKCWLGICYTWQG